MIKRVNMMTISITFVFLCLCIRPVTAEEIMKWDLEDTSSIGLVIQNDSKVKTAGIGSIKITTLWPTTVCIAEVEDLEIENAKLIYKVLIKSDLDGMAFLEMWAHVAGSQYFSRGINDPVKGKSDWKYVQTPFLFQKGQKPAKVTLNLIINGKGTVWIDEVLLLKRPLK